MRTIRELLIKIGLDAGEVGPELDTIDGKVDKVSDSFKNLGIIMGTLFTGEFLRRLLNTADAMQMLQGQVGNSIGNMDQANAKFNELAQHANDMRTGLEAYVDSWAKMNMGIKSFGGTVDDTTRFMDTLSASFTVNGTATQSAEAALFQLGQTMQSGVVQGEEMNSLLDAQGTLAHDMMIEIAGTVPAYKKMQAAGKVTAKMLMDAVNKQYPKWIAMLEKTPRTMGQVWKIITNDMKVGLNNFNDGAKLIPKMADQVFKAWQYVRGFITDTVKQFGNIEEFTKHVKNLLTPLAALLTILTGFKALTLLASPVAMITALAAAIGLLYDDYITWKEGGESFIDWAKWEPEIQGAITNIKELKGAVGDLIIQLGELLGTDFSKWTLRKELESIKNAMSDLAYMGKQLAEILNGLQDFDMGRIGTAIKNLWQQGQPGWDSATQTFNPNAPKPRDTSIFTPDKPKPLHRRPDWWPDWLGGPGDIRNLDRVTQPLNPNAVPGVNARGVTNVNNNVDAPMTVTVNVTQQPGEDGNALATRITDQLRQQKTDRFDFRNLLNNGGAK